MADQTSQPNPQELTITDRELAERLSWFIWIRWFAGFVTFLLLLVAWNVFNVRFNVVPVIAAIGVLFLYNAVLALTVKGLRLANRLSRDAVYLLANVQVIVDLILVGVIWNRTGGVENAFGIFFIFPMVWASELLSRRNAYFHAMLGAVLIHAVVWGEYTSVLSHVHLMRIVDPGQPWQEIVPEELYRDWAFVFMVGFTLSGALFVTVFLAGTIADRLRSRERELEETYRSLKSLDDMKSQFMRKASHELRAPLAAIHTMLKTVLAGSIGSVEPRQEDMLRRACDRTGSLIQLINDLLRYSRLEAEVAARIVRREPVALGDVVRRTLELLSPSAEEKRLRVDSQIRPAHVLADDEGLTELVTNLVSNAIRYTPNGRRVGVSLSVDGDDAVLVVHDEGIGISPDDLPHVFEEFFRSEAAKKAVQHGTGMGLAIVHRLAESYGGRIDVASRLGKGSTFTVRLPLARTE